jgi:hypothetical protein
VTRRTPRLAAVAVLAALVLPLASCQNLAGTAAYVGDRRITTAEVDEQVDKFFADKNWSSSAQGDRDGVYKQTVRIMVIAELLKHVVRDEGIKLPESAVNNVVAEVSSKRDQISPELRRVPLRLLGEAFAYDTAVQQKIARTVSSQEELNAKVSALMTAAERENNVTVNPRYGTFNAQFLAFEPQTRSAGVRDLPAKTPSGGQEQLQPDQPQPGQPQQPEPPR